METQRGQGLAQDHTGSQWQNKAFPEAETELGLSEFYREQKKTGHSGYPICQALPCPPYLPPQETSVPIPRTDLCLLVFLN